MNYKFVSTKEYNQAFPVAYRQWRADDKPGNVPGCNKIHGYALSLKFYFGANELDVRNWVIDYGGLRPLKEALQDWFDHTLLVASDDPQIETFRNLQTLKLAKVVELPALGCEALADLLYQWVNEIFIPDNFGSGESERVKCFRVEVRETDSNMAYREEL